MQLKRFVTNIIGLAAMAGPVMSLEVQPTTMVTLTKRTEYPQTTTVTVGGGIQTGEAAPQISDLPKHCVVDGPHLKMLPHHERHDCEHRISHLTREDARLWVEAWTPVACRLREDWSLNIKTILEAKQPGEDCSAEREQVKECEKAIHGFKHQGNKKAWLAGMLPLECPYRRDDPHPPDVPHDHMDHALKKKCETLKLTLEDFGDMMSPWRKAITGYIS